MWRWGPPSPIWIRKHQLGSGARTPCRCQDDAKSPSSRLGYVSPREYIRANTRCVSGLTGSISTTHVWRLLLVIRFLGPLAAGIEASSSTDLFGEPNDATPVSPQNRRYYAGQ
jgi:hypothetical protein